MASKGGDALTFIGNALIPQTMANFRAINDADSQKKQLLGKDIAANALLSGANKQLPARPGAFNPGMTMGPDGNPSFNPTQSPGLPARPVMSPSMTRSFGRTALGDDLYGALQAKSVASQLFPTAPEEYTLAPGSQRMRGTEVIGSAPFAPEKPNLNGDWVINLETGQPEMKTDAEVMAAPGKYAPKPSGMRIMSDGQGGFEMTTGGQDLSGALTKPTQTKLEDAVIQGNDALARMKGIQEKYKPEYQQLGTRWENLISTAKDKMGVPLDEGTKRSMSDFASYRRDAAANQNQTIKDLTGATVGADEAPRLMLQMPVAGQGLFDGDGPIEFQAKMKASSDAIAASIARAQYARKNGLDKKQQFSIPLDTIPQMINQKGTQYAQQMKAANPGADESTIKEMVKARLREEFGL